MKEEKEEHAGRDSNISWGDALLPQASLPHPGLAFEGSLTMAGLPFYKFQISIALSDVSHGEASKRRRVWLCEPCQGCGRESHRPFLMEAVLNG